MPVTGPALPEARGAASASWPGPPRRSAVPYNTHVPAPAGTPDEHADDENHPFSGQAKFSLVQAMSSMMALGLKLEQVVPMVTSHPAEMLGLSDTIGALRPGMDADVSVLKEKSGRYILRDNQKTERMSAHSDPVTDQATRTRSQSLT
jgi:Amidohydrolase family